MAKCVVYQNTVYFSEKEHYSAFSIGTYQMIILVPDLLEA
jgi:hypothetical protein